MSSSTTNDAIARSAARLRWLVFAAMGVMVLLYAAARFGLQLGNAHVEYQSHADRTWSPLIGDVSIVLLVVAMFRLTQLLGRIAAGELFTAGVIGRFRSFAFWLLLMALFGLFAPPLSELLSAPSGPGARQVELRVDFQEVLTVGVTLVLFLLARLLERARRLDEEIREFV